jgi:RHS repeat-associated protein
VTDWRGRTSRYTYDANGRVTAIAFPNGTRRLMEYNTAGDVTRRKDLTAQGGIIVEYRYSYDAAAQMRVEGSPSPGPASLPQAAVMTFGRENRLATFAQRTISYDANGNMTSGPLGGAFAAFTYDYRSNLMSAGMVRYEYDEEDRLIAFVADGRRTRLIVDPQPALSQVLMQIGPDGAVTRYVYGIGLIYEETGGQTRTYHYDHRGSTAAFTSDGGGVTGTLAYGPYGEILERTGTSDSLFLFTGLFGVITDPNGLYFMRYRWYSPETRRFISEDAHFGGIVNLSSLNRYSYAGGNPVMRVDPHGEWWTLIGAALGATYGVVAQAVSDAVSGQKPDWRNYVSAAIGGAVYGAVLSSCPACGFTAGAASASAQYLTDALLKGKPIDPLELTAATLIGGATGKLFQAAGSRFSRRLVSDAKPASLLNTSSFFRKTPANRVAIRFKPITGNPRSLREIFRVAGSEIKADAAFWLASGVAVGAFKGALARTGLSAGEERTSDPDGQGAGAPDRLRVADSARGEINRGAKGTYGEFIHWRFYLDVLRLAARPVPNNPNNLLTSF